MRYIEDLDSLPGLMKRVVHRFQNPVLSIIREDIGAISSESEAPWYAHGSRSGRERLTKRLVLHRGRYEYPRRLRGLRFYN
ncbi:hypothetical protein RvY_08859 [Ramazzottius varieornatus]|uniref:Uncharacterized protein n=1 Tax=Ramazzottius varieornatus TaxID=947166 RepID=A0A1D1V7D4_RAMVA|nr:hypothetical protein RvY_08859 [Ramazzottius varieornatus]